MTQQLTKEECLQALKNKMVETGNLPKKSDFTEYEVSRIKAFFGPWPRALEAAGLTAPRTEEREAKKLEKRINAKRKKTQSLKQKYLENIKNDKEKLI